jgi:hypothetical protein
MALYNFKYDGSRFSYIDDELTKCDWCGNFFNEGYEIYQNIEKHGVQWILLPYCSAKCYHEDIRDEKTEYINDVKSFLEGGGKKIWLEKQKEERLKQEEERLKLDAALSAAMETYKIQEQQKEEEESKKKRRGCQILLLVIAVLLWSLYFVIKQGQNEPKPGTIEWYEKQHEKQKSPK